MNALALAFLAVLLNRGGLEHRLPEDQVEFAIPSPSRLIGALDRFPKRHPSAVRYRSLPSMAGLPSCGGAPVRKATIPWIFA
jgi:hypothetical protein